MTEKEKQKIFKKMKKASALIYRNITIKSRWMWFYGRYYFVDNRTKNRRKDLKHRESNKAQKYIWVPWFYVDSGRMFVNGVLRKYEIAKDENGKPIIRIGEKIKFSVDEPTILYDQSICFSPLKAKNNE